jgi:hypothetical protein
VNGTALPAAAYADLGAQRLIDAPNAMGNFCFDVTLSYRRLELPRRFKAGL